MRIASVEHNALNWVSISSARALNMTHCDVGVRSARDEDTLLKAVSRMSSIGSDKDQNRDARRRTRTTWNSCANCTKRMQREVAPSCMS